MRTCDVVILGPDQLIQRSFVRKQVVNACARVNSKHCVHVTDHSIKDSENNISVEKPAAPQVSECV